MPLEIEHIHPRSRGGTDRVSNLTLACNKCNTKKGNKPPHQTGDIVKAVVTTGKKVGTYVGRVAVRTTGSFNISTANGLIQGISHKYCSLVHRKDGYQYCF